MLAAPMVRPLCSGGYSRQKRMKMKKTNTRRGFEVTLILIYVIPANGEIGLLEATKGLYRHWLGIYA